MVKARPHVPGRIELDHELFAHYLCKCCKAPRKQAQCTQAAYSRCVEREVAQMSESTLGDPYLSSSGTRFQAAVRCRRHRHCLPETACDFHDSHIRNPEHVTYITPWPPLSIPRLTSIVRVLLVYTLLGQLTATYSTQHTTSLESDWRGHVRDWASPSNS
jgi:hypothetical protein